MTGLKKHVRPYTHPQSVAGNERATQLRLSIERGDIVKIPVTSVDPTEATEVALDQLCNPVRLVGEFWRLEP